MTDVISRLIFSLPPLARLILVLTGSVLIHLTIGTYHTFGNMLPYMASYMRNYTDSSVRIEDFMWVPTFQGCFPFSMVIGGTLSFHVGPRTATLIGCTIATSAVALSYWSIKHSFFAFFITYGLLFGLGQGIAYVTTVATVINWAPEKVGLVSGIVAAGFGVSSSIFAPIQTRLINPDNLPSTRDGYFLDKDLLLRVPNVFLTLASIYAVMQLVALIVVCDPPEKIRSSGLGSISDYIDAIRHGHEVARRRQRFVAVAYKQLPRDEMPVDTPVASASGGQFGRGPPRFGLSGNEPHRGTDKNCMSSSGVVARHRSISRESRSSSDSDVSDVFIDEPTTEHSMRPREMLSSSTFYFLFSALFCCSFYANMFYNLYKTFAETFVEDDFFLARAFAIGSVANAIARVAWGYLTDRTSFQVTVSVATCMASALLLTMPITKDFGRHVFLLWLVGIFICMGATHALFITSAVKCFGVRWKATNYGFLTFSTTCSGVLLSVVSQYYLTSIGYTWLFIVTAAFPFTAFLVTSLIHLTPQGHKIS